MISRFRTFVLLASWTALVARLAAFVHFEARHTHPLALSPDGVHLVAVNSIEGRLSVFRLFDDEQKPLLLVHEIPVGLEPVSVAFRNPDEAWVVNELSDSVCVVRLSEAAVTAVYPAGDEPSDVVFAGENAFLSIARENKVRVLDVASGSLRADLPLEGLNPASMAVSPDGQRVYVAFLHSGNNTTVLPANKAPAPPAPLNPSLPAPPKTALIVSDTDSRITYDVIDHDIAVLSVSSLTVSHYIEGVGTNLLALAVSPDGLTLWAAYTEANNLIATEPSLRGRFIRNGLASINLNSGQVQDFDLNPEIAEPVVDNALKSNALALPMALVLQGASSVWVGAYGSDRLGRFSASGERQATIDLRAVTPPRESLVRGPRGLALDSQRDRLYVLNKLSDTLSVVDASTGQILAEKSLSAYDPMPSAVRKGRAALNDARLSGNGLSACASCHIDADRDGLAWDLGDPSGQTVTVVGANLAVHDLTPRNRLLHPMKGPMVTQTLRGITDNAPFHWRGDRPTIQSFNDTFPALLAGQRLSDEAMNEVVVYLKSIARHPNPNQTLERGFRTNVAGGNAQRGLELFLPHLHHCSICHTVPDGTDNNLDDLRLVGSTQTVKTATLRNTYQKAYFTPRASKTLSGFGLNHDGTGFSLPRGHFYELDSLEGNDFRDLQAFVLSFDTGTAPAVGHCLMASGQALTQAQILEINTLEAQASEAFCDLIVRASIDGQRFSLLYEPSTARYVEPFAGSFWTRSTLESALLMPGNRLFFMGVPYGQGLRFTADRSNNGQTEEARVPRLTLQPHIGGVQLSSDLQNRDWILQSSSSLESWQPEPFIEPSEEPLLIQTYPKQQFFRLFRTW